MDATPSNMDPFPSNMDEILERLVRSIIESRPDSPNVDEPGRNFEGLYKNWGKFGNQEQRRRDLLRVQRSNRNSNLDGFRGILKLVGQHDETESSRPEKAVYRPSIYVAGFTKTSATYNNVLMLSEWLVEKPADFEENWLVVPCPKGIRTLVVANKGTTKCYSKYGNLRHECNTALPGGNPYKSGYNSRWCVLDCFQVDSTQTMYILDLLAWNNQPMTDGETEFRYYWLQSQLDELPELDTISKNNQYIFKVLPKVSCSQKPLEEFLMKYPQFESHSASLDGLLFYHKKAQYFAGETPLVGWLYPYMIPEVIGTDVKINSAYMLEKPDDYVNQAEFIDVFEKKLAKKKKICQKKYAMNTASGLMETEPSQAQAIAMEPDAQNPDTHQAAEQASSQPPEYNMWRME